VEQLLLVKEEVLVASTSGTLSSVFINGQSGQGGGEGGFGESLTQPAQPGGVGGGAYISSAETPLPGAVLIENNDLIP